MAVTTKQLAERLGVTPQNVIYHIKVGNIRAEKPGGRDFLIAEAEAERVVAAYERRKHKLSRAAAGTPEAKSA
jgi:excisionase family DNA binding protein